MATVECMHACMQLVNDEQHLISPSVPLRFSPTYMVYRAFVLSLVRVNFDGQMFAGRLPVCGLWVWSVPIWQCGTHASGSSAVKVTIII